MYDWLKGFLARGPKINTTYLGQTLSKVRDPQVKPQFAIIHAMSAIYVKPDKRYDVATNIDILKGLGVSAHYIIDRTGEVYQLVDEDRIAYHAGKSEWNGHTSFNRMSLGVELLGCYEGKYLEEGFTEEQYKSLAFLGKMWKRKYGIKDEHFLGHSDISGKAVRPNDYKKDPGPKFDWDKFRALLKQ